MSDFYEKLRRKANSLFGTNVIEDSPSLSSNAVLFRAGKTDSSIPANAKPLDRRSAYAA